MRSQRNTFLVKPDYVVIDMPRDDHVIIDMSAIEGTIGQGQAFNQNYQQNVNSSQSHLVPPIVSRSNIRPQISAQSSISPQHGLPPRVAAPLRFPRAQLHTQTGYVQHLQTVGQQGLPQHIRDFYNRLGLRIQDSDKEAIHDRGKRPYLFVCTLGSGAYATVYKAIPSNQMNEMNPAEVAIKVFRATMGYLYQKQLGVIKRENAIVDRLMDNPHQNVLQFIERFKSRDRLTNYIVMEVAQLGDLFQLVRIRNSQGLLVWTPLDPQYCRHLIRGVAQGVRHLFALGISHGDIKLENILITYSGAPIGRTDYFQMIPKLVDFNNSKMVDPRAPIIEVRQMCTPYTAAPESHCTTIPYDMKIADVYSVGASLLAMLLGCQPFTVPGQYDEGRNNALKKDRNFIEQLVQNFDNQLKRVLLRILEPDPQNRITIDEFLADHWFQSTA